MSIMIREYFGFTDFSQNSGTNPVSLSEGLQNLDPISPNSLYVDIEGIHEGPTRNFTRYMKEALKSSMKSWTYPYPKPLIKHHNEKDGDIIGRINQVEYKTKGTLSGTHALLFKVNIPDKEGAEQVRDGRLLTTSIGVIAHDIRCSCCGYQITDENGCPDHVRGGIYDGEYCYWDIYDMEAKELSYVVVPSDIYAKNVKIYDKKEAVKIAESLEQGMGGKKIMDEKQIQELQESLEKLQKENEEMATSLKEANEAKDALAAEKESISAELTEANEKIEKISTELKEKTAELENEVKLRESVESEVIELKEAAKKELISNYAALRKIAGKAELSESAISTRSVESLKDSITDLQLELSESVSQRQVPPVVTDPTITESKTEIVKKEKAASNIDLEEGLQSLFSGAASHFVRKQN